MATYPVTIRIAMLNADIPVPNVLSKRGSYGNIFHNLLVASAARIAPNVLITAQDFDVIRGQYPSDVTGFDVILITGSSSSSYDDNDWIRELDRYVLEVYETHPHIKIFGSCFGHQVICQSLLRKHGVFVEKQPSGWELGVHEIALTDEFRKAFSPAPGVALPKNFAERPPTPDAEDDLQLPTQKPSSSGSSSLRLQFIHADHVKVPSSSSPALPYPWMVMGSTKKCAVQGVYEPGRVFTFQGHFEFDRFINTETVKVFGEKWERGILQGALDAMEKDDDSEAAADMVVKFLMEGGKTVEQGNGGLLTPPLN